MINIEEYLNQIPMWAFRKNPLEDIQCYMNELGNPDESMNIIHVAGTNGKGSVCAFLTSVLVQAGYQVGTFVSPHLVEIRERFLINGSLVGYDHYRAGFERVRILSDTMVENGFQPLTYFEFLFYMSMVINSRYKPDFVILETGLGGRLDTTNVIKRPLLTILTSISRDHMEFLGETIEEIAGEKAGILKEGVPVVYDDNLPEASQVITRRAKQLNCPSHPVSMQDYQIVERGEQTITALMPGQQEELLKLEIPSEAEYQVMNASLAVRGLLVLQKQGNCQLSKACLRTGIESSRWPGRMEQVLPGVYLDGAHNVGGIQALIRTMEYMGQKRDRKIYLLFAVVSDKEYKKMIEELSVKAAVSGVCTAGMASGRSTGMEMLVQEFQQHLNCPVWGFQTVEEAFFHVISQKGEDDLVFCIGSLYLIGEIKQILRRERND